MGGTGPLIKGFAFPTPRSGRTIGAHWRGVRNSMVSEQSYEANVRKVKM